MKHFQGDDGIIVNSMRNPIDPARLAALPETTLCVKCKNELEKAMRRAAL